MVDKATRIGTMINAQVTREMYGHINPGRGIHRVKGVLVSLLINAHEFFKPTRRLSVSTERAFVTRHRTDNGAGTHASGRRLLGRRAVLGVAFRGTEECHPGGLFVGIR